MFCIEIVQIIGSNPEKIFYIYIEDDMKCKVYTFYSINLFFLNAVWSFKRENENEKPVWVSTKNNLGYNSLTTNYNV